MLSGDLGANLALGCPYTLSPAPNYTYCTDPGDATQLTDGVYTRNYFWTQPSTVGWMSPHTYAQVRIDLGSDQPIHGVSFNTAAGTAGVTWPTMIGVLVSTDGVNFYDAGEVIRLSLDRGVPPAQGYRIHAFWTDRLVTHGRYVKIVAAGSPYLFVDEIEVYRGPDEMLSAPFPGSPITDVGAYVSDCQLSLLGARRIVADAQLVAQQVDASTHLTAEQKTLLAAQLESCIDQALLDYPTQVIIPVDDLHREVFRAQAALWRAQGFAQLSAWAAPSAWDQLSPTQSPLGAGAAAIDVAMMTGEFRSAAFNLSNPTAAELEVTLSLSGLPGGVRPAYVTVHEVQWTDTRSGVPHLAALPEAPFDPARDAYVLHVPSGMTRQVWLTLNPPSELAGASYAGTIVADAGWAGTASVPVALRVSSLAFPAHSALGLGGWDYTNTTSRDVTAENRDALIATLREHFVDIPWATNAVMPNPPSFGAWDEWVARWPDARRYCVFLSVGTSFAGCAMGTPEFGQAVGAWISAYAAHWRQTGIDPDRVALLVFDEPNTAEEAERIIAWAGAIKAAEPDVLIWEDPRFSNPADASALYDACDVLCPNRPQFLSSTEQARDVYRQQRDAGKTLEFYSCSGPTEKLDPYSYYRLQAWTCWDEWGRVRDEPTAMYYWAFGDQGRSASWTTSYGLKNNFSPLFLEPDSVTDGKAMEAIREGVEDYEYLHMLKGRIAELQAAGVPASALADAQALLDAAPSAVLGAASATDINWSTAKDRGVADHVRGEVLQTLEQLAHMAAPTLDVDGNGAADALSDGILILRYLFDPDGPWAVDDALGPGSTRAARPDVQGLLHAGRTTLLDADGNGQADPLTDGILILRDLFDPTGTWSVDDALGVGATRTTRPEIQAFLAPYHPATTPSGSPAPDRFLAQIAAAVLFGQTGEPAPEGSLRPARPNGWFSLDGRVC